ncbi:MAG: beta-galactosidase [Candidatus Brocadiia bacterium]
MRAAPGYATFALALAALTLAGVSTPAGAQTVITQEDGWFPFEPTNATEPGVVGMADWLDAPAGKHGYVQIDGDGFSFEDGTPVVFWGVNNGSGGCAPNHEAARQRAAWYSRYGVNAVRLHKFTNPCKDDRVSTRLKDDAWDRIDYYCARLRDKGVYYGWSHIYGHRIRPGDRDRLLAYEELEQNTGGSTYGIVNYAKDLQDLHIDLTVNMLNHRNPYTGLRYAEDPALNFIELQNEDDIFFGPTQKATLKCPTYKRYLCKLFSDWLRERYGDHEGLVEAWGEKAINAYPHFQEGEHLDKDNIYPICHHWYFGEDGLAAARQQGTEKRMLDTARFLYETQMDFYNRFVEAIRETGYRGPIVGSCWQAGGGVSHFYNLHADYSVGFIDRHNYFGGGGHRLGTQYTFTNESMLGNPGGHMLSTGKQQVMGRPFALSEWISKVPNEWVAEGPPIVATYGMGLQGWDASYHFASKGGYGNSGEDAYGVDEARRRRLQRYSGLSNPHVYNLDSPTQIGQYPAIARMLYRGDLTEAPALNRRKVNLESLAEGKVGFTEDVRQEGDIKVFEGPVPPEALAVGKVQVEFTEEFEPTEPVQIDRYVGEDAITSNTGQLRWSREGKGFFTVDTPGTKAVVGHAGGRSFKLGQVEIDLKTDFAVLWITSLERDKSIAEADRLLLTVVARARNTGMEYEPSMTKLREVGHGPILMEPVEAKISLGRSVARVSALDHDGVAPVRSVPVDGDSFSIDGRRDRAIYYEITF